MGTSIKNGGAGKVSALIPSWLEPGIAPPIAPAPFTPQMPPAPPSQAPALPLPELPVLPEPADPKRFQSARTFFNKSVRTGRGGGGRELRKAASSYVRKGYGGSRNAARRVSNSTRTAGKIIGFAQAIRDKGFQQAAKEFGVTALIGKPINDAINILIDAFTGPATTTDENITREAWCEAVKEMIDGGVTDIEKLTPAEWATAVEGFICKAIELRVFNEIGIEAVSEAQDVAKLDQIENDLTSLIRGQVQDTIVPLIQDGQVRSQAELDQHMTSIAERAYDYLDALGDQED
jgi:hypothetical protein